MSVLHIKRKAPSRLLAKQGLQSCHCSCRRLGLVSVASQVKPSQGRPSSVCVCVQMMIRIMIIEMLIMTMLRPNFHMRQPSLFGLTSQTREKFACQVGITASQTNESWPKTTYGHTHTLTPTRTQIYTPAHLQLGDGILQIPSHSSCGSRWRNQPAVFTPCGFGQNRQNLATATGGKSHSTLPRPCTPCFLRTCS